MCNFRHNLSYLSRGDERYLKKKQVRKMAHTKLWNRVDAEARVKQAGGPMYVLHFYMQQSIHASRGLY